jgi:YegS/Rv2252/BmrU family lipid kinase
LSGAGRGGPGSEAPGEAEDPAGEEPSGGGYPVEVGDRFFVLLNPRAASGGDVSALRRRVAAQFAGHGVPFDLHEAPDPASALSAARSAARAGCRAVAAVGGDGTVARALRGTAGTEVPVAIIPFGTGNQLAANFGIPTSLEGSVRVAVEGEIEPIDLGRVDGEYFALIAGAGLDAEMVADATDSMKERLGFAAYLLSGLKHVVTPKSADFRIVADGKEIEVRASMVLLANVGLLAAGSLPVEVQVGPKVSFRDGLVDVCIYAPRTLPDMARMLWQVARQEYAGNDKMLFLQAREVRVEADPPVAAQIDGEPAGETPFEVEMLPLAGRILVP